MGNSNSAPPPSSIDVVRRPPSRPKAPPSSRPISQLGPNGPSYTSPENRVLPKEIPIMKLRPVSMELSKYHPEYQNIFSNNYDDDVDGGENVDVNGESKDLNYNSPPRPPPPIQNGHIMGMTQNSNISSRSIPNGHVPTDKGNEAVQNTEIESVSATSVKSAPAPSPYRPSHKRQMSLTTKLTDQEHTIFEEPEEHFDYRGKIDALYPSFPGVPMPVKNNFNLDYSYQLTYVQLAEHRRQKTLAELERRTGKKLSDLTADLNENVERPVFMRDAPSCVSTGSGGSALSSKKKRAPAPPQAAPPAPSSQNLVYSINNEPPADYDLESPRRPTTLPRYTATPVSRVAPIHTSPSPAFSSRMNKNIAAPSAPPPPTFKSSHQATNLSRNNSMSNGTPEIILKKVPTVKSAPQTPETDRQPSWLAEIKNLSESIATRRQISVESGEATQAPDDDEKTDDDNDNKRRLNTELPRISSQSKLIYESSKEEFTPTSKADINEKPNNVGTNNNSMKVERNNSLKSIAKSSPAIKRHHSTTVYDRQSTPIMERQSSAPNSADPVRRLSSLIQHDIKAAALAQCHKLVKQTSHVSPKPKDPHEVFREQLAKACAGRDERTKLEGTIDEKLNVHNKNVGQEVQEAKENFDKESPVQSPANEKKELSVEAPETKPKPPRYHKKAPSNKHTSSNIRSRQQIPLSPEGSSKLQGSKSFEWTPEDDLESDDNISDREEISARAGKPEGFKSTIIPHTVTDLKKKNKKGKEKKYKSSDMLDESPRNKYGSVKRFKKSMHRSVKNAFGSISRASGKVLRKQKAEDLDLVEEAPKNWKLSTNSSFQNGDISYDRSSKYQVPDESDSDTELFEDRHNIEFVETDFRQNGDLHSEDSSDSDGDQKSPQKIKRAGVAYLNSKGQLVFLPDYDTVAVDESGRPVRNNTEGRAPKLYEKKKKFNYDATPRRKEREENERVVSAEIRHKEKQMEEERRKQLELELEMHKIREAETRERLQRLENAHLHQQINAQFLQQQQQQQQQQQNLPMLTAPTLPLPGTFPPNYNMNDNAQIPAFSNLYSQQMPQNGFNNIYGQNGTVLNSSLPYDVNDYMRLLGLQNPQTTQQAQQVAFLLNNMNMMGQPFERRSNPTLYDMLSPDHIKQFPSQTVDYQGNDTIGKKQNMSYQTWASAPNINTEHVNNKDPTGNDFVNNYQYNGANSNTDEDSSVKSNNPIYASDDSDEGLSPVRTVASAQVKDFRPLPVRTESGKFMRKYGGTHIHVRQDSENSENSKSDNEVRCNGNFIPRRRSISPTNSVSTTDSVVTATSLSLSTQSSPSKSLGVMASPAITTKFGQDGYRTVVDLTGTASPDLPDNR